MHGLLKSFKQRNTFISRQLRSMSLVAVIACVMDYIGPLVSTSFIGRNFGEQGLVIAGVISPITTLTVFCCDLLIASGVYLKGVADSSADRNKGQKLLSTGFTLAVTAGVLIGMFLFFGKNLYLSFFDLSEETCEIARGYIAVYSMVPLLSILKYYIYELVFRMGKKKVAFSMDVCSCILIIVCSIVGLKFFGIVGVALANVAMITISGLMGVVALVKNKEMPSIQLRIDKESIKEILSMGFMYSQMDLYYLVYSTIMYAFIGRRFGESCMAIFSLLDSVTDVCSAFYGVPYAAENYFGVYLGEDNTDGVRKTLSAGIKLQIVIAIVVSVLVIIFAGPDAEFFGMEEAYYAQTIFALRIYAASFIFYALLCFNQDYYACIEASAPSVCISISQYLLVGIVISILLGVIFGEYGIYLSVFLECPIALLVTQILIMRMYHSHNPFILDFDKKDICSIDFNFNVDEIMDSRDWVEKELIKRNIPQEYILKILLAFEESCMLTQERNKKKVYGECSLFFEEKRVDMIIRDSGEIFDSTEGDQEIVSLRSYIVSNLATHYKNQRYYVASNNNRITFRYKYEENKF